MGQLCQDWEKEAQAITAFNKDIREVRIRIGVVIGTGGALQKMRLPFSLGLGGKLGSGTQWMNWVHVDDLVRIITTALDNPSYHGPYNAVSPGNVTNAQFTKSLANALGRFAILPVPSWVLRIVLGEMSIVVTQGQEIRPSRLLETGFIFKHTQIDTALTSALCIKYIDHLKKPIPCRKLHVTQWLDRTPEDVFDYFSNASNLEDLTPSFLKFKIASQSTPKIQQDTQFVYHLRVRSIPITWISLILDWHPLTSFVDTQLKGPYRAWHHTHRFIPYQGGTLIEDEVYYALPNIPLITPLIQSFVDKDVRGIFEFRKQKITKYFGKKAT